MTKIHHAQEGLLLEILENPDDDLIRLVYADWLEDHGQEDRAELIRVGCARARSDVDAREDPLYHRECELYALDHVRQVMLPPGFDIEWGKHVHNDGVPWEGWLWKTPRIVHLNRYVVSPILDRGFIGAINAPEDALLLHFETLWAMHPIRRVEVFCKRPTEDEHVGFSWLNEAFFEDTAWPDDDETAIIPQDFYDLLPPPDGHPEAECRRHHPDRASFYGDADEAQAALSAAVVRWARLSVGLDQRGV